MGYFLEPILDSHAPLDLIFEGLLSGKYQELS